MKAITLVQPRATLIAIGALLTETRPQATPYRGPVAIHAGFWIPQFHRNLIESEPVWSTLRRAHVDVCALPRSMVVAVADLVDCVRIASDPAPSALEARVNDWSPGQWVWRFANVDRIEPPIRASGHPGLWDWSQPSWWRDRLRRGPAGCAPDCPCRQPKQDGQAVHVFSTGERKAIEGQGPEYCWGPDKGPTAR